MATKTAEELSTKESFSELIDKYDNWLFDCDGVIWGGNHLFPGAAETLSLLRSKGKKMIFVTNNATKSRRSFKTKFDQLGLEVHLDEIFGSAYATAVYLRYNLNFPVDEKKVYVIGQDGLEEELHSEGFRTSGGTDPEDIKFLHSFDFSEIHSDLEIGAVICGFDMNINYKKLAKAFRYLSDDPSCLFVLTNDDSSYPANGTVYPGSGALSAPLRYSAKQTPIVVGKPNKPMLDCILAKHHLEPSKTIMVGDRLDTDIEFAIRGGISSLLVFTGVVKREDYFGQTDTIPTYLMNSLGDLSTVAQ